MATTHSIQVDLPDGLYRQAQDAAERSDQASRRAPAR